MECKALTASLPHVSWNFSTQEGFNLTYADTDTPEHFGSYNSVWEWMEGHVQQNFLFLCLTVKIKINKHFASAILVVFYMGKQKTLTFGRPLMASCRFIRQHDFCLNTGKTLKATRNAAILTSLCWSLTGQQSAQLIWLTGSLDNHNLPEVIKIQRKEPGIGYWFWCFHDLGKIIQLWCTSATRKTSFQKGTIYLTILLLLCHILKPAAWQSFHFSRSPCTSFKFSLTW